ncbi:MAG: YeeE/YedE family protein [Magnetospirillum sp.]|nr:YeeE/YedE family protein [Magnetospirillum sp.]
MTSAACDIAPRAQPIQWVLAASGFGLLLLGTTVLDGRLGLLLLLGAVAGVALLHGAIGFASAYRVLLTRGDGDAVLAHVLMLAAATVLFAPVLAQGTAFGQPVVGAVAPLGVSVVVGALLFGIGMQVGGACASGCLCTTGGGNVRTLIVLPAFCVGAFWGSLDLDWWLALPAAENLSLAGLFGWEIALPLQLAVLAAIAVALRRRAGATLPFRLPQGRQWLTGPWPPAFAVGLLAVLNWATLVVAGHPWTITWAFALWGAKAAQFLGWDPASSGFWNGEFQQQALASSVLADPTSVMDFGLLLGAFIAATAAGTFRPSLRIPPLSLAAAVIGGLLMGYGARLSFGCNIGAFFSGVASTSLHGWLWIAMAVGGTWVGIRLRRLFGLEE